MNHNTLGRFGGWALVLLAATQGLLLGVRQWPGSVASDPWLTAGDHGLRGKRPGASGAHSPPHLAQPFVDGEAAYARVPGHSGHGVRGFEPPAMWSKFGKGSYAPSHPQPRSYDLRSVLTPMQGQ